MLIEIAEYCFVTAAFNTPWVNETSYIVNIGVSSAWDLHGMPLRYFVNLVARLEHTNIESLLQRKI